MFRFLFSVVVAVAALIGGPAPAEDIPPASVTGGGARVVETAGEVILSIEMTRPVGWRVWAADEPPRVVLELSDFSWAEPPALASTPIASLEIVETGPSKSELHAILREPLEIYSAEMTAAPEGGAHLEVRLKPTTAEAFLNELAVDEETETSVSPHLVVAIDPGHGGVDPGAEAGELKESDLVLDFAKRLRDVLLASGQFDVVLTRSDDSFASLDERLSRARAAGAQVMLSIHADALEEVGAASGIVLYRLAGTAAEEANERIIERHDPTDQLSGVDLTGAGDDVSLTLVDIARRSVTPRSRALSSALLAAFESGELKVNTRPERSGGFAVLKAADIPSILIELGFLSTEEDLLRLTSEDWQTAVAQAIRDGLILWSDEDRLR